MILLYKVTDKNNHSHFLNILARSLIYIYIYVKRIGCTLFKKLNFI